ncbi:hypothetical protein [Ornithobacterium rhinotracheale]
MKNTDFKIVFDSDNHEVDVETLVGCLMHTSNIIQEVNRSLETDKKIEIKIKALEKGSFEVHIELVEKLIASLFSSNSINYAAGIVTTVGGLYHFAKFLAGNKPRKIENQGDNIKVENNKGDVTIIKGNVYNIYNENKAVRDNISKQFEVLKKNDDISGFKFESKSTQTYISEEEFAAVATKIEALDDRDKEPKVEIKEDCKLYIVRASFSNDLKWDFIYNGDKISAKMNDENILSAIDNGEQFAKGDYMVADMEITLYYDPSYGIHTKTKDSYKILKYKEHIKGPKQTSLFDKL